MLSVKAGIDPRRLDESGWGVIFADNTPSAIREALEPILALRREQGGDRYRLYEHADGYRTGKDTKSSWLARHGQGPGPADPDKVPYYLLIVGDLEEVPLKFQQQLDVQYAVGRLWFDTADEAAAYATSVVAAETNLSMHRSRRRAVFFAVRNDDDQPTSVSAEFLVGPLAEQLAKLRTDWAIDIAIDINADPAERATKGRLLQLIKAEAAPDLLLLSGHGMVFPSDDPRQGAHQGALLCADWPGPSLWQGPVPSDFYFSADDVPPDARLLGRIVFMLASYSAGTTSFDFSITPANRSFLARLPQKLLGHPQGGALAFVGLADRMWGDSSAWPTAAQTVQVWTSVLQRLMSGDPVGFALEYLNERNAELSIDLSNTLEDIKFGMTPDQPSVAGMWTANNDARACVILGDPAVRLP
jgi:hypothetical protein